MPGVGDNLFRVLVVILSLYVSAAHAQVIVGHARVVDGDTVVIGKTTIRLHGIDTPEPGQTGGAKATAALSELIAGRLLSCEQTDVDLWRRRVVAICKVGERNLNASMISAGFAWAYVRYSRDYVALEQEARRSRVGIWHTDQILGFRSVARPQPPWEYRAQQRRGLFEWARAVFRWLGEHIAEG